VEQTVLEFGPARRIFTVTELNAAIGRLLGREFSDIWVAGEISGVKLASSGHYYFTLKERDSQLRCVLFRSAHRYLRFKPQDGLAVVARGHLDIYEARGEYQLQVEFLEPQGHGALQLAFEQLKKKLADEGLFDEARKKPLPKYPRRIGIVTSPQGAAIRDMLQILSRRFPGLHIRLYPAQVQGDGSIEDVCRGIQYFSRTDWAEVMIVGRGGGSIEDLWTFNEEAVARAIAASKVPVVSAVGHATDVTIADFVADLRAPTPSAAAELIVCTRQELLDRIAAIRERLSQALRYRLSMAVRRLQQRGVERATSLLHRAIGRRMQRIDELEYGLRDLVRARIEDAARRLRSMEMQLRRYDLRPRLAHDRRRLDAAAARAEQILRLQLARRSGRLQSLAGKLSQLSPLRILDRGYAIVTNDAGVILKRSADAAVGSNIDIRLAEGRLAAEVTDATEPRP
jgi:exodeoxyribonuclease VII large subunit